MQKTTVLLLAGITAIAASAKTTSYTLTSPDGKVSTEITAGKTITFTAAYNGSRLLEPSHSRHRARKQENRRYRCQSELRKT